MPVLDSFERALEYDYSKDLRAGLNAPLRRFEATGTAFDTLGAEVEARGCLPEDELLRPAQVIVAKPK